MKQLPHSVAAFVAAHPFLFGFVLSFALFVVASFAWNTFFAKHSDAELVAMAEKRPFVAKLTAFLRHWGFDPVRGVALMRAIDKRIADAGPPAPPTGNAGATLLVDAVKLMEPKPEDEAPKRVRLRPVAFVFGVVAAVAMLLGCSPAKAPSRATLRGELLTVAAGVKIADEACASLAESVASLGPSHLDQGITIADKCSKAYDEAVASLRVAADLIDAYDDVSAGAAMCAVATAGHALHDIVDVIEVADPKLPPALEDALAAADAAASFAGSFGGCPVPARDAADSMAPHFDEPPPPHDAGGGASDAGVSDG